MSGLKKLLGKRIKELRKQNNLKQEELAEIINIATRNLSNIETGNCFPSPDNIEKLSVALNCKIRDLFDFEHHQEPENIYREIIERLKPVDETKLKYLYKIVKALTE